MMDDRILELLHEKVDREIESDDVDIVPDRQIQDLYAVRTGEGRDYLVNTTAKAVEKVQFDRWPPS